MGESRRRLDAPASGPGLVLVVHGANEAVLPLGGRTVGWVRHQLGHLFNFAPDAQVLVNVAPAADGYVLRDGETLEFILPEGRKGVGRVWTQTEFIALFKMGETDFDTMVAKGLPVHRMGDGTVRITETQVDDFLDHLAGKGDRPGADRSMSLGSDLSSVIAEVRRIADALDPPPPNSEESHLPPIESPYLNIEQAAIYLKKTPKAIYGLLERSRLKKMPGSHVCYFTKYMLDDFLRGETANGRGLRPGRRKKN
jgi:hypothetical protein